MGILISLIIAFIAGICLVVYGVRKSYEACVFFGGLATFTLLVTLVVILCCSASLPSDFAYAEERYNNLKHQIGRIEVDDIVTGENLRNQVLEMNNEISKHRCYSSNIWVGMWYSERVGSLEPLEWKSAKQKED